MSGAGPASISRDTRGVGDGLTRPLGVPQLRLLSVLSTTVDSRVYRCARMCMRVRRYCMSRCTEGSLPQEHSMLIDRSSASWP